MRFLLTHSDELHSLQLQGAGVQALLLIHVALEEGSVSHGLHLRTEQQANMQR